MRTQVVNIRLAKCDMYIGRAGYGEDGYFGNPVYVGKPCPRCGQTHMDRGSTLPCYRAYFYERLASDPEFYQRVAALRGLVLGCFCKPNPCHGDVIIEWIHSEDWRYQ